MSVAGMPYQIAFEERGISVRAAAWIHTLFWTMLLALPMWLVIDTAVPAIIILLKNPPSTAAILAMLSGIPGIGSWLVSMSTPTLSEPLSSDRLAVWASANAEDLKASLRNVWVMLAHIAIALLVTDTVSRNRESLGRAIKRIVVWSSGDAIFAQMLLTVTTQSIRSVLLGMLGVTLFNGILVGAVMAFSNLPSWPVWAVAVAVISSIPMGAMIIIALASVLLLSGQHWTAAIVVFVLSNAVTLSADLFIKPRLTGAKTHTPFIMTFLSILGGIEVFGLIGLIIGPVIVLSAMGMWQRWEDNEL